MSRIKITNVSNHRHGVRLLNTMSNDYNHRTLSKNQSLIINDDQFFDLWNTTVDFKSGILSFDIESLTEEHLIAMGITKEEASYGIVSYDEKQIKAILSGKIGEFNAFIKQVKELDEAVKFEFSKKLFSVAENSVDDITKGKADAIEEVTGMKFDINAGFKNSK
jgi:hypothetical protein